MRVATPLLVLSLLLPASSFAQVPAASLKGRLADVTTGASVPGAQVKLTSFADSTDVHRATAGDDGRFEITGLAVHAYRLETTRIGYAPLKMVIRVTRPGQDAGVLGLTPESVKVSGITVTDSPAPAVQRADTTEFRASAVKTHPDATAEDLVQKMPGVTMENGQVKAQGETVQNVLVNGRPFFGSDPTAAMRNLPADVVDRIQVYDRASDQAEFSGFDDGQSQKTMNFILRDRKARFGKFYGGYGDQDHYQAGGNATWVKGTTRLSLIGLANDINQRNFSPQDLIGALSGNGGGGGPRVMMFGGPRGGGGGQQIIRMGGGFGGGGGFDPSAFLVSPSGGIATTSSGGLNYVSDWGKTLQVSASAFLNGVDNVNTQTLDRSYVPPQDSTAAYHQDGSSDNRNGNQRFDARIEWAPDSLNSVIVQPRLYFQGNDTRTRGYAANRSLSGALLNRSDGLIDTDANGDNLSNRLTLRHRFAKRGRNVSADINAGHTTRDSDRLQQSVSDYFGADSTTTDTLDQRTGAHAVTNSVSTRIAYTEPVNRSLQLQLTYNPSWTRSTSDSRTYAFDAASGNYASFDSAQSNVFANRNTVQNGGAAALYKLGPWRMLGSVAYQRATLHSEQTFPRTLTVDHAFEDVLPSLQVTGNFANRRNLRFSWNTSTVAPSIIQLQNVVDRSNPLAVSAGNPGLRQSVANTFSLRLSEADPMHSKARFLFANVTRTRDPIANATYTAATDTVIRGIFLGRGTQLTIPVNLDESWSANVFGVYSLPAKWLKSIISLNGGGAYNLTPTQVNATLNRSKLLALRFGAAVSSNVSPRLDYGLSYQGSYNMSRSTLVQEDSGDYYSHNLGARVNWITPQGVVLREELTHNFTGLAAPYGLDQWLFNSSLGRKFLKDGRGELRVTVTDVLGQDRSATRTLTETYVQDTLDRTLGRFTQLVFTYTWK